MFCVPPLGAGVFVPPLDAGEFGLATLKLKGDAAIWPPTYQTSNQFPIEELSIVPEVDQLPFWSVLPI